MSRRTSQRVRWLLGAVGAGSIAAWLPTAGAAEIALWVAPTGGYSTYAMDSINDRIAIENQIYRPEFRLDAIEGGAAAGALLGADVGASCVVSLGYERLWGESVGVSSSYDVAANVVEVNAGIRPFIVSNLHAGFDLGIGVLWTDGENGHSPTTLPFSGQTPVFDGAVAMEYRPWSRLGFLARIGYRYAVVEDANGDVVGLPEALLLDLDYSGLLLCGGVRVGLHGW